MNGWLTGASIGLGLLGGIQGALASKKAARQQAQAAIRMQDLMKQQTNDAAESRDRSLTHTKPYNEAGGMALKELTALLGVSQDPDARHNALLNLQGNPGYQFRVDAAKDTIENSAAAMGNLQSGNTMQALNSAIQGVASDEYGRQLANLRSLAGLGYGAANSMSNTEEAYVRNLGHARGMQSNAIANEGVARASGTLGKAQALNNALGGTVSLLSLHNYLENNPKGK